MPITKGHEEYLELAASYALEVLEDEDRLRFERHLASGCELCPAALLDARRVAGDLALLAPRVEPPESLRASILDRIGREREERPDRGWGSTVWWMAAAASFFALALGLGLHVRELRNRMGTEARAREGLEQQLAALRDTMAAFTAPRTHAVSLEGQAGAEGAAAKAFVDPVNRRLFLYVYNLPPPPPGRTYQLWLIVGGSPVSMGTFGVEPDGSGRLDTTSVPSFEGEVTVAVSVEPQGGVPQPTGPIVLFGS